jgi:hypothetical protein
MWDTDTIWFDAAVVCAFFALGNICFGRFSEYQPRLLRVAKLVVTLAIVLGLSAFGYRMIGYALLGAGLIGLAYVHAYWLPKHGVNGWTAEPRDRYERLIVPRRSRGTF